MDLHSQSFFHSTDLLLWNCRSFSSKIADFRTFMSDIPILVLTESNLPQNFKLNPYVGYHSFAPAGSTKVSIFVHKRLPQAPVHFSCSEEGLHLSAVHVGSNPNFIIIGCYITGSSPLRTVALLNILQQCTAPVLLLGDFNGHNPLWGSSRTNARGKALEDLLLCSDLVLLNDDSSPTFTRITTTPL